ncbi:hypothetical protein CICLE_v10023748mg [Citrus x clementina]|uniref:Uncharacterized protein n=1 Tax=Citrus clementina TaxID=85681 RepID=V4T3E2_CITCL|nr:hypothetical protein CICLE_v10023748mg [Citrus x clementina]
MRTLLFLPLSFFLFAFIEKPLLVLGNASPDPVLDIIGKQLRAGNVYYILAVILWKLHNFDAILGQWFVTTRGIKGNLGPQTTRNWFRIEKFYGDYKLV